MTSGLGDELLNSLLQRLASLVLQSFFLLLHPTRNSIISEKEKSIH